MGRLQRHTHTIIHVIARACACLQGGHAAERLQTLTPTKCANTQFYGLVAATRWRSERARRASASHTAARPRDFHSYSCGNPPLVAQSPRRRRCRWFVLCRCMSCARIDSAFGDDRRRSPDSITTRLPPSYCSEPVWRVHSCVSFLITHTHFVLDRGWPFDHMFIAYSLKLRVSIASKKQRMSVFVNPRRLTRSVGNSHNTWCQGCEHFVTAHSGENETPLSHHMHTDKTPSHKAIRVHTVPLHYVNEAKQRQQYSVYINHHCRHKRVCPSSRNEAEQQQH